MALRLGQDHRPELTVQQHIDLIKRLLDELGAAIANVEEARQQLQTVKEQIRQFETRFFRPAGKSRKKALPPEP